MASAASKDGPEAQQVTSVRYLDLTCGTVLCVSSTGGTQIYNEDATTMLYFVALNDSSPDTDVLKLHQGACCVSPHQHIVLGTSKGSLMAVQATALDKFTSLPESAPSSPTAGVADVCYAACVDRVVTAHQNGELRYWWAAQGGQYCNDVIIPATTTGQAPVHVATLGPRLAVAFGPGTICLFDAASRELQVEITAHARWITAMTVREDVGQIATVGEDTALNVWQVDAATGQIGLAHTSIVADKLLTGVVFHSAGCAVTAYDSDELFSVAVAPPVA
jgi:WD40 repeat protein